MGFASLATLVVKQLTTPDSCCWSFGLNIVVNESTPVSQELQHSEWTNVSHLMTPTTAFSPIPVVVTCLSRFSEAGSSWPPMMTFGLYSTTVVQVDFTANLASCPLGDISPPHSNSLVSFCTSIPPHSLMKRHRGAHKDLRAGEQVSFSWGTQEA